jgi:UDP-N-acetylglucosamine 2-epimerase (non-hydrolysing)
MPEEINRLLTDQIADLLLTPSQDADENLRREGIPDSRIRFVGNVMIDSLFKQIGILKSPGSSTAREDLGVTDCDYAVLTLHRPSNVDDRDAFTRILDALDEIGKHLPIIFPVHPRTRERLIEFGFAERIERAKGLVLVDPLGYLDFLAVYSGSRLVLTDSGGIQEETTALGIPCLTLRENTERPITVELGTNQIVGTDTRRIVEAALKIITDPNYTQLPCDVPLWDGHAAERICDALVEATRTEA